MLFVNVLPLPFGHNYQKIPFQDGGNFQNGRLQKEQVEN
jgi:hypothetical protein